MPEHAFLRVETLVDLADAVTLLKRGAVLGIEPIEGGLFGPARPCALGGFAARGMLRLDTTDLAEFLTAYLSDRGWFERLIVPDGAEPEIREAWEIINHAAATYLSAHQIIRLIELVARRYGGVVDAQIGYGADGWVEVAKAGGTVVCWGKPPAEELADLAAVARSIVNAEEGQRRRSWFAGVAGPYLMPNRGLIRWESGMAPRDAYARSGEPTGLGPVWDSVAGHYRLCGIVVPSTATDEELKAEGWAATSPKTHRLEPRSQDIPVRPVRQVPRSAAAQWIDATWGEWVRVDLT